MNSAQRFVQDTITLDFEDAGENPKFHLEVYRIAPEGSFALNKTTTLKNIKHNANAGLNVEISGVGKNVGYSWDLEKTKGRDRWTKLLGIKRLLREYGKDNAVLWSMEENKDTKNGIPSFFWTAVLLRRSENVSFSFTIKVRAEVNFVDKVKTLFGLKKPDPVNPVRIDPDVKPKDLKIGSLDADKAVLANMESLNLGDYADVVIVLELQPTT